MSTVERYELTPLRDWYLAAKPNPSHACETLGYWRYGKGGRKPDTSRLLRDLGIKHERKDSKPRCHASLEKAARLCRALGVDPVEVGL